MRLLDLIEQHDRIGLAAHGLGELAALVVTHVSRRGTDQALDAELLHVLGHVDAHHGLLGVEQVLGECLGELGLAHARGAQEHEAAHRAVRVGKPRAVAANGARHRMHGLVLADDALMQLVFQVGELLHLALHHLLDRDARPCGHHLGDLVFGDLLLQNRAVLLLADKRLLRRLQALLQLGNGGIAQLRSARKVALARDALLFGLGAFQVGLERLHVLDDVFLVAPFGLAAVEILLRVRDVAAQRLQALLRRLVALFHERLFLDLHLGELALGHVDLFGHRVDLDAQTARRLVHQVDRLIGKEAVGDVAIGKFRSGDNGAVGDAHAVVNLVLLLQAAQNGDGVLHRRLADRDRLETTGKRLVLLDILAVLVKRRRADGMKLTARERRLEHVARIERAVARGTGAHDGVQLVDEQDDLALGLLHLAQHRLQAVLELAAVLRTRHHRAQIERHDVAILQAGRHVACDNALSEPLDDGRLARARLADEHRVVLGAAGKHLNGAADFLGTADHRVEFSLARLLGEVLPVLLQGLELGLFLLVGHARVAAELLIGRFDVLARDARAVQDAPSRALVLRKCDEQMLACGVAVAELLRRLHCVIDRLHEIVARHRHGHTALRLRAALDLFVHVALKLHRVGADALDDCREVVLVGVEQCLQQVNRLDNRRFGIARHAHGVLERLLGGDC